MDLYGLAMLGGFILGVECPKVAFREDKTYDSSALIG